MIYRCDFWRLCVRIVIGLWLFMSATAMFMQGVPTGLPLAVVLIFHSLMAGAGGVLSGLVFGAWAVRKLGTVEERTLL
jgi:glucose dehydrogenase